MMKPEEFANEYIAYCQVIADRVFGVRITDDKGELARCIAARDTEVREEKRKRMVAEMERFAADTIGPVGVGDSNDKAIRDWFKLLVSLDECKPPAPEPSERAIRVAKSWYSHPSRMGAAADGIREHELALLIDAEFSKKEE